MLFKIIAFSVIYWLWIFGFSFANHYLKKFPNKPDRPGYKKRVRQTKDLIKDLGYKLGFQFKGKVAFGCALPFSKSVFLSEMLLRKLDFSELLYVVYHEAGHIKLGHANKQTGLFVFFLFLFVFFSVISRLSHPLFAILLALVFGNIGIHVGRLYEDQADDYALRKLGFEGLKKGILALHHLKESPYDHDFFQSYFSVHRTHLAKIDRLKAKFRANQT